MDFTLQALADPIRREILLKIRNVPLSAGAIAGAFRVSRPAVSRHLRVLRKAGLVSAEILGRERFYRLDTAPLTQVYAYLARLRASHDAERRAWDRRFMSLETEVCRIRARGKAATRKAVEEKKRKSG
jgi:DNA-binding transcriptional ArsR family regulator